MTLDAITSAWKIIPAFKSTDIQKTADFYTKELHFFLGGMHQDPTDPVPTFLSIAAGKKAAANIYYALWDNKGDANAVLPPGEAWVALGTEEIDQYYEAILKEGRVKVVEEIGDKPWGYRQFKIADPDGNVLTLFRFLEGGNPGTE